MSKKTIICLFVVLMVILSSFCIWYFLRGDIVFDILIFNEQPQKEKKSLHCYDDEQISLNKVLVRGYYFVVQDEAGSIISDWQEVLRAALAKASEFYELQFAFNMEMDFKIYPQIIYSNQEAEYFTDLILQDYQQEILQPHSKSKAIEEISRETEEKIKDGEEWKPSFKTIDETFVINLFVIDVGVPSIEVEDGLILGLDDEATNTLVFSEALVDEEFKDFYSSIISHELGHSLGIPEFYTYSGNKVRSYGVMGGGFTRKLQYNYLDYQIKEKMGLDF